MWEVDSRINPTDLSSPLSEVAQLHSKYYRLFIDETLAVKGWQMKLKVLKRLKYEYYSGSIAEEDLVENGWEPNQLKILRTDIPMYIDADKDVVEATLKMSARQAKADYLESIIRQIQNRGYNIKTLVDYQRFRSGSM